MTKRITLPFSLDYHLSTKLHNKPKLPLFQGIMNFKMNQALDVLR